MIHGFDYSFCRPSSGAGLLNLLYNHLLLTEAQANHVFVRPAHKFPGAWHAYIQQTVFASAPVVIPYMPRLTHTFPALRYVQLHLTNQVKHNIK